MHGLTAPLLGTACKGECPVGQVAIATDGTSCQPGTYSYYCCDNPNAPALPAPADVSFCPSPPNIPGRNNGPDPDGAVPHIFAEANSFDSDCTLYGLSTTALKLKKRGVNEISIRDLAAWELEAMLNGTDSLHPILPAGAWSLQDEFPFEQSSVTESEFLNGSMLATRNLVKRTRDKSAAMKFCAPGQAPIQMIPQTYSGFRTIARLAGKGWITIAKPTICGAIGVAAFLTQPSNTNFVTEHVFEKQTLRNIFEYMVEGKLPGGGTLAAGTAVFNGVFDPTGAFFTNWPQNLQQSFGAVPLDTFFGALGHAEAPANYDNLQVCDADLNAIKARITAGSAFISTALWNQYGDQQKIDYLTDVIDTFSYMKFSQTVKSWNSAYKALILILQAFAKVPNAQAGYDYVGAFKEIVNADLNYQIEIAQATFKIFLKDATDTWNDPALIAKTAKVVVKANQAALKDFATNLATYIAYDKSGMTA